MVGGNVGNLILAWVLHLSGEAYAYSVPVTVDLDLTGMIDLLVMILSALCVVWIGRKLVRLMNRS